MKLLKIPYLSVLNVLDMSSIKSILEQHASRDYIDQVNWPNYKYKPISVFDIAHSGTYLFIHFFVRGATLKITELKDGLTVSNDNSVGFLLQISNDEYFDFSFNAIGICNAIRLNKLKEIIPFSPEDYNSISRYTTIRDYTLGECNGIYQWELTIRIPFSLLKINSESIPRKITGNFYSCAKESSHKYFLSWNHIESEEPNFDHPNFFAPLFLN